MKITIPEALKPYWESVKFVARLGFLFVVSWIITQTMAQINAVPEFFNIRVWVFDYLVPVRAIFNGGLFVLGAAVDKALHEIAKVTGKDGWLGIKGLTGF